jgi:PBSX family phage terminase large subunit
MEAPLMKQFGPKAHQFIMRPPEQDSRYNLLVGTVRSSKTFALDAKTIVHLNRYKVAGKRFMVGTTKQTLYRNVLLDLFNIVGKNDYSYDRVSGELWLYGQQWFCMGAKDEASYKQILGATVGLSVCDEVVEYPKSFLAQMFMRMSPEGARFYGSTNAGNPYCYLKAEVIDNPEFARYMTVINFSLKDNPNLSKETKYAIIASQSGFFKLRYIDGLWVVAEGSIYRDSWNDVGNTYTNATRPIGLRGAGGHVDHWFAVDPGVDHPQVYGEFYDDGHKVWIDRVWRWDSRVEMRQKTDGEYADDLEKFMGPEGRGCEVRLPPEAASLRAEFSKRGFWVLDADNSVIEGIHTVSTMLSQRMLAVNTDQCCGLEKRIPSYAWNEKASLRGLEEPLKQNDDDVDMVRYGVHGKINEWRFSRPE